MGILCRVLMSCVLTFVIMDSNPEFMATAFQEDPAHDHYQLQAKQDALQGVEGLGAIPADDNAG